MIRKSIFWSKLIVPERKRKYITNRVTVPKIKKIVKKSFEELKNLKIAEVSWANYATLGFKLSDGQECEAGKDHEWMRIYKFNPDIKITRIETIIN